MARPGGARPYKRACGGRTWWAHFEFTRINTTPTILYKKIEDLHEAHASTSAPPCDRTVGSRYADLADERANTAAVATTGDGGRSILRRWSNAP
jgi:hypothetical protein